MPWASSRWPARYSSPGRAIGPSGTRRRRSHDVTLALATLLCCLEHSGLEGVALEQAVELGAVASGEACGLRHVAACYFQDSYQIIPLERLARLIEGRERGVCDIDRLANERFGDHFRGGKGHR